MRNFIDWLLLINTIVLVIILILERRSPEKTIAWLLVFALLPPLGIFLYLFIGRNWKKHKLNNGFSADAREMLESYMNTIKDPEMLPLLELLAKNSDSPLFINNHITIFNNGEDKFRVLKEELWKAKHHIHMEYFIVKSDQIGNEIKDILVFKAREGVAVRFIMDRVGSIKVKRSYIKELREAGVDVIHYSYFLAPLLRFFNTQINYRNHRKIVVIDGQTGFVGGMNIGNEYLGKGRLGFWRDTHIMVKGDFAIGLQAAFLNDFIHIKKTNRSSVFRKVESLPEEFGIAALGDYDMYCPKYHESDGKIMQLVLSGPDSEFPSIMQCIFRMISMAEKHICIMTPYFIPTESIMEALKVAALGGIEIKLLFPGKYDHYIVYYASQTYLRELIKYGVKIYFYDKDAFLHSKVVTVDGKICTVGTANMDIRSYLLNYEVNAVIYDEEVTRQLEEQFERDLEKSVLITEEYYEKTSGVIKLVESTARILSYLL
ncbi:MAG: cardiolipin synthase [Bacillota bacterium]